MGLAHEIASTFDTSPALVTLTASTAKQVSTKKTSAKSGIVVNADSGNGSPIYLGDSLVDATHYTAIVQANDPPILIPISDASKLYAYSTGVSQKFGWSSL